MKPKNGTIWLVLGLLVLASAGAARAQQLPDDVVFYNGKIITVDDPGFSSRLGTVAQAMHVHGGKVQHVGTDAQIRSMAGAATKLIDLKGRTVIPGFILSHEHPWDWSAVSPQIVKKVLPDDIAIVRVLEGSPDENLKAFPAALADAVAKAKPGEWIYFIFTLGKNYEYAGGGNGGYGRNGLDAKAFDVLDGKHITKKQLDAAAPNNPVLLRDVFISSMVNQKAFEEARKVLPQPDVNVISEETGQDSRTANPGFPFRASMRWMFHDVMLKDHYKELTEVHRLGMEWWAGYGLTAFASNAYDPANLRVYRDLDRKGQMPIRNMWTWNWRPDYFYADPFMLADLGSRVGEGSDYLWFGGGIISTGAGCTTADIVSSSTLSKSPEIQVENRKRFCSYAPGSVNAKLLFDYVKAGGRFVNMHTVGDQDIDNIMKVIIDASKAAGMSEDEIRAKRHGFDHGVMWPRPDQIPVLKRYGFVASGDSFEIAQSSPAVFDVYGEKGASWVVPKKRLVEGGIYNSMETDRALPSTELTIFSAGIAPVVTRKGWDGKVYASDQQVDRQTALKIATTWGSFYLMREKSLGSLEPGKWADFSVLDRDYLTVPEGDIGKLRVLMTVVGGRAVHITPSLAKETGLKPAGAQVDMGAAAQW